LTEKLNEKKKIDLSPSALYGWLGDRIFSSAIFVLGFIVIFTTVAMAISLYFSGSEAINKFGFFGFMTGRVWDAAISMEFGTWPFIVGTLVTSLAALALSFLPAVAIAIFTAEYAPKWLGYIIENLVNLIAAVPSVVIGIWGIFVFTPWVRDSVYMPIYLWSLESAPSLTPILGNPAGYGMLTATIILTIMIIPFTTALACDSFRMVPKEQREAASALGATKWEVIRMAVIPYSRGGILAGAMLSLGRAIGETMAVAMLIGNKNTLPFTVFGPGSTMASVIVNEFREAVENIHLASLMAVGFYLFLISLAVNLIAAWIQRKYSATGGRAV